MSTVPPQATTAIDLDDNHTVGVDQWPARDSDTGAQGQVWLGMDCLINVPDTYHVHTHLSIFLNGEALAVPDHVGVFRMANGINCFYPIHTHDKSGKIHVEAAASGMFTLGQLFNIWGRSLSNTDIGGLTGMPVVVYVTDEDHVVHEAPDDWENIELKSHREITIQIGTPITEIPNFTWSAH